MWAADVRKRTPTTVYSYRQILAAYVRGLGKQPILTAKLADMTAFTSRPRRGGKPAASSTIRGDIMALRAFYSWAMLYDHVAVDPSRKLLSTAPSQDDPAPRPVDDDTWCRFWRSNLTTSERAAFGLAAFSGLRRAEVAMLKPTSFVQPGWAMGVWRKGGGRHNLPYEAGVRWLAERRPELVGDPEHWLKALAEQVATATPLTIWSSWRTDSLIWTRLTDAQSPSSGVNPDAVNRRLRRALKRAGMPPDAFGPHQLRHAFVTWHLEAGMPLHDVSRLAHHADPKMTMRYLRINQNPYESVPQQYGSDAPPRVRRWE